jgi:hypothetical protein
MSNSIKIQVDKKLSWVNKGLSVLDTTDFPKEIAYLDLGGQSATGN